MRRKSADGTLPVYHGLGIGLLYLAEPGTGEEEVRLEACRQLDGRYLWAIRCHGNVLCHDGTWEWEPLPSARDEAFIGRARYGSIEAARYAWQAVIAQNAAART